MLTPEQIREFLTTQLLARSARMTSAVAAGVPSAIALRDVFLILEGVVKLIASMTEGERSGLEAMMEEKGLSFEQFLDPSFTKYGEEAYQRDLAHDTKDFVQAIGGMNFRVLENILRLYSLSDIREVSRHMAEMEEKEKRAIER